MKERPNYYVAKIYEKTGIKVEVDDPLVILLADMDSKYEDLFRHIQAVYYLALGIIVLMLALFSIGLFVF